MAQAADDLVRKGVRPVELLGRRRDLLLGEVAHGALQQTVIVG